MNIRARQASFVEQARAIWQHDPQAACDLYEKAFEGGPSPEWGDAKLERYGLGMALDDRGAATHLDDVQDAPESLVGPSAKARLGVLRGSEMQRRGVTPDWAAVRAATSGCREHGCRAVEELGHRMLGDHARHEGRMAEAIEHYRIIIARREEEGNALGCELRRRIATMLRAEGRIDEALAELRAAETFVARLTVGSGMGSMQRQEYTATLELRTDILVELALAAGRPDVARAHADHLVKLAHGVAHDLIRRAVARQESLAVHPAPPADDDPLARPEALVPPESRLAAERAVARDPDDIARITVRLTRAAGKPR